MRSKKANDQKPSGLLKQTTTNGRRLSFLRVGLLGQAACLLLSCAGEIGGGENTGKPLDGPGLVSGTAAGVATKAGTIVETLLESPHNIGPNASHTEEIFEPGATFIKVHFGLLELKAGDVVLVSDTEGNVVDRIYYDGGNDDVWAVRVPGDTAWVTLNTSATPGTRAGFAIDKYSRGIIPLMSTIAAPNEDENGFSAIAICGADDKKAAACFDGAIAQTSQAIAQLTFTNEGGSFVCTGELISGASHLITNNHCISDQAGTNTLETTFNYQNSSCSGTSLAPTTVIKGGTFLKTSSALDYTLVQLPNNPAATFGFLQVDTGAVSTGTEIYIPQHPGGRRKEIATTENGVNCVAKEVNAGRSGYTNGSQMGYTCDTEGGSSGSAVIRRSDNKMIALHHLGGCNNAATHMSKIMPEIAGFLNQTPPQPPVPTPGKGGFDKTVTVGAAIPDNSTTGIASSVSVTGDVVAAKIIVSVDISHTYRGDLIVKLTAPSGQSALVSNKAGGSADDLKGDFDLTQLFPAGLTATGNWTLSVVDSANADTGILNSWRLKINDGAAPVPPGTFVGGNSTAVAIPDNNTTGVSSVIAATGVSTVNAVQVEISVAHSWRGDLLITLTNPQGVSQTVVARSNPNDSADNVTGKFNAAGFTGNGNGNWTLKVTDGAAQDVGTLNFWKLAINTTL
jgi:subtilisin-like proprotein convertase family protein